MSTSNKRPSYRQKTLINAQPRTSAHPTPPPAPLTQNQISAPSHPTPFPFHPPKNWISTNKRLSEDKAFCWVFYRNLALLHLCVLLLPFVAKKKNILHLLKWWKCNKCPASNKRSLSRSKNLLSAQGGQSNKYVFFCSLEHNTCDAPCLLTLTLSLLTTPGSCGVAYCTHFSLL